MSAGHGGLLALHHGCLHQRGLNHVKSIIRMLTVNRVYHGTAGCTLIVPAGCNLAENSCGCNGGNI